MLKAIARLLFGGEEQPPDDFKSGEMSEEEWQVVSHQGPPPKMQHNPPVPSGLLIANTGTKLCLGTCDVSTEVSSAENQGPEQAAVQRSGSAQPQAANTQAPDVSR